MANLKNSWGVEGIMPGQPHHGEEWEKQRRTLLNVIHRGINVGLAYSKVMSVARAWNQQHGEPFQDFDVIGMVNWSWRKFSHKDKGEGPGK